MVRKPVIRSDDPLMAELKKASAERDAYMRSIYENETPAQKNHRANYNKFMGVPEHEL